MFLLNHQPYHIAYIKKKTTLIPLLPLTPLRIHYNTFAADGISGSGQLSKMTGEIDLDLSYEGCCSGLNGCDDPIERMIIKKGGDFLRSWGFFGNEQPPSSNREEEHATTGRKINSDDSWIYDHDYFHDEKKSETNYSKDGWDGGNIDDEDGARVEKSVSSWTYWDDFDISETISESVIADRKQVEDRDLDVEKEQGRHTEETTRICSSNKSRNESSQTEANREYDDYVMLDVPEPIVIN
jgi:hypothetical protein